VDGGVLKSGRSNVAFDRRLRAMLREAVTIYICMYMRNTPESATHESVSRLCLFGYEFNLNWRFVAPNSGVSCDIPIGKRIASL